MVCCVTGHRPNGFPFPREKNAKHYENYLYRLRREMELLYNKGYRSFLCHSTYEYDSKL